jgi:hypothetical protein
MSQQTLRAVQTATFTTDEPTRPAVIAPAEQPADIAPFSILSVALLIGGTIALVSGMFWIHALGSPDCQVRPPHFVFGVTSEVSASIPAGVPCTIAVRPGNAVVDALSIDVQPKSGTLSARGRTGVIYRPNPNTKGPDEFAFSLHGGSGSAAQRSTVRIRTDAN